MTTFTQFTSVAAIANAHMAAVRNLVGPQRPRRS